MNRRQRRRKKIYGIIALVLVVALVVTWVLAMVLQ